MYTWFNICRGDSPPLYAKNPLHYYKGKPPCNGPHAQLQLVIRGGETQRLQWFSSLFASLAQVTPKFILLLLLIITIIITVESVEHFHPSLPPAQENTFSFVPMKGCPRHPTKIDDDVINSNILFWFVLIFINLNLLSPWWGIRFTSYRCYKTCSQLL